MDPTRRRHYDAMLQGLIETHIVEWHKAGKSVAEITRMLTASQNWLPGPSVAGGIVQAVIAKYEAAQRAEQVSAQPEI